MGYKKNPARAIAGRVLLIAICAAALSACAQKKEPPKAPPPVPVLAAKVEQKDVPVEVKAIGNVEAYSTVSVKSLVAGEITAVGFKEGQCVKKGDLLFAIDPRPTEASLRQAEAGLARDKVQMENARTDAKRYEELVKRGVVSKQQYDQARTAADALVETVNVDKAAVDNLKVQLGYTKIYSPLDGRTGNLNVNRGNIVKANDTPYLVVITQVRPIYVAFSVPEQYLSNVRTYMAKGKLKVDAYIQGDAKIPVEGALTFVDNMVDVATGTIKLKGTFQNAEGRLWPGQFVDTVLRLTTRPAATVIPTQAIQTGQQGQYVFVVGAGQAVEMRQVSPGSTYDGFTIIEKGVAPGETVVTDGQLRLVPGAKVEIKPGL